MKKINGLLVMVTLTGAMVFNGCSNDVYDPNKVQTEPTKNPLGEDFSAPNGFNWSMINTVKLNVSVKDEFAGQYNYLIEVFTSNPLSNPSATPIAAATANQNGNYTSTVEVPKTFKSLYIRQTDPNQRKTVFEYAIPTDGGEINCQLYFSETAAKAFSTRATVTHGTSGWNKITTLSYTEQSYTLPTVNSVINSSNQLPAGGAYLIKSGEVFTRDIDEFSGANATVYVQGTWNVPNGATLQGLDIIVLDGGKINGNFKLGSNPTSTLTIQKGGLLSSDSFETDASVVIKNFGTMNISTVSLFNTNTIIYNGEGANINVSGNVNKLSSSQIHNYGNIVIQGYIDTNDNTSAVVANYETGVFKAGTIKGGALIINNNLIETASFDANNVTESYLYNNCTFVATSSFKFAHLVLDKGSVTAGAGANSSELQKPVPQVSSYNDESMTLNNGSFLKATSFNCGSGLTINAGSGQKSMLQIGTITYNWTTNLGGNLVLAVSKELNAGTVDAPWNNQSVKSPSVQTTTYDGAKYNIENCSGIVYEGDPGVAPYNPTIPAVNDATKYTYAFEDNWPVYGDFDLNDLVVSLDNKTISSNGKTVSFNLTLEAVGASKQLGLGVRLMNLTTTPSAVKINGNSVSLENDSKGPAFIVFDDAHRQFGYTDSKPFINTVKDGSSNPVKNYTVTIEFSSAVSASAFNINNFDLFIISKVADTSSKRTEIHVAGYPPTDLGNTTLFGQGNDGSSTSSGKYYLSTENLAWGVVIPTDFSWPLEYNKISDVYTEFKPWVTSGGKNNGNWFNTNNGKVY